MTTPQPRKLPDGRRRRLRSRLIGAAVLLICTQTGLITACVGAGSHDTGGVSRMEDGGVDGPPETAPANDPPETVPNSGWEVDATTVGLAPFGLDCASLEPYTGPTMVEANTTITEKRVTTDLNLSAGNITVERSCIQPTAVGMGMPVVATTNYNTMTHVAGKVTIRDSEIDGSKLTLLQASNAGGFLGAADLIGNYVHGLGGGIAVMMAGDSLGVLIERNYVTGLVATENTHSDAFTVRDFDASEAPGRSLVVRNNRFDCDSEAATGALFVQTYSGRIDNLLVEGNLLEGGGYQLGLNEVNGNVYTNARALNNRFTGTGWGPAYVQGGPGWTEWADNYRYDPAAPDAKGAEISAP